MFYGHLFLYGLFFYYTIFILPFCYLHMVLFPLALPEGKTVQQNGCVVYQQCNIVKPVFIEKHFADIAQYIG